MNRRAPILVILALLTVPAPASAQVADEAAVEEVVRELFRHMKAGDADAMAALMHDDVRLVTTAVEDGVPVARTVPVPSWLDGVRSSEAELDERLYDVEVRVSQGLATVWTGYDLLVDGAFSHCGVDAFQLVDTAEGWRILQVADTRKREGCPGR